jgi:hypothetical protein
MKNLKDAHTKIVPSKTRGGKELPSSSALDSPSVLSKLATPPPITAFDDMSHDIDDATSALNDAHAHASPILEPVPLGELLDSELARAREMEAYDTDEEIDIDAYESPSIYKRLNIPEGYVFEKEVALEIPACKDRDEAMILLAKMKEREKTLNARMKHDPAFATSPIFVTDEDYDFSVDPELITLVESDPFHGYEIKTVVAHLTKLNDIATLFAHEKRFAITIFLSCFLSP